MSRVVRVGPVRRVSEEPVVHAGSVPGYGAIFNAGVVHHEGRFHLVARGVRDGYQPGPPGGPRFIDYVSDILVFESGDGAGYDFAYVLAEASPAACWEDPRVQRVCSDGREHLVMTYTHLPAPEIGGPWRIGVNRLEWDGDRLHLEHAGAHLLGPDGVENKDAVIFNLADGRVAMIHRIHPDMQLAVFDDLDALWHADETYWADHLQNLDDHVIIRPGPTSLGVGAGAPPVATDDGLLLFFHERRGDGRYTMNLAVLDSHTGRVRHVLDEAVLEPERHWERRGDVDDVVFVQGAHLDGGQVYLTYGAADRCIGAARADVGELFDHLAASTSLAS